MLAAWCPTSANGDLPPNRPAGPEQQLLSEADLHHNMAVREGVAIRTLGTRELSKPCACEAALHRPVLHLWIDGGARQPQGGSGQYVMPDRFDQVLGRSKRNGSGSIIRD